MRTELARVIIGQEEVIERLLISIFGRGHALLVGVPGLAKTLLVRSLSEAMALDFSRIQFTPDLMPSDITGTEILQETDQPGRRRFEYVKGPIFANVVLADEINRAPPKTQSALLEAMQEHRITAGGHLYHLPAPFFVLATQNPVEQEGTYPLPEAQLDRFMFLIHVGYPSAAEEGRIARETTGRRIRADRQDHRWRGVDRLPGSGAAGAGAGSHLRLRGRSRAPVPSRSARARRSGSQDLVTWGAGPRAVQYLILGAKARAALARQLPGAHRGCGGAGRARARAPHPDQLSCRIRRHHEPRDHPAAPRGSAGGCARVKPLVDPKAVARLLRAQVHARLPMSGNMSGQHKSPHKGSSVEFAEYRKYVPGDDIRLLDWRVYARTDRFYLKEFEADTNLRAWFVVDGSASMGYGSRPGVTKLGYAARMAATLAYHARAAGRCGRASPALRKKTVLDIPARRNAAHLRHIFDGLGRLKPQGETALVPALHALAERIPQRSLVLLFSDCFTPVEQLLPCFQHLRFRKHDLAVFHLLDRAELDFDFTHPTRFVDLETQAALLAEPEIVRARYFEELNRYLARIEERLPGIQNRIPPRRNR